AAPASAPLKVLRVPFSVAETTFDPAKINDLYSRTVTPHIFEALYQYDHLARPAKIKPLTAAAMPEHSADFTTWTVRLTPGIYFADDPAFKGQKRELVAQDYAYAYRRIVDPANKSPIASSVLETGFKGLAAVRDDALKSKTAFDYDRPIEGIQVLDRYTLRFQLDAPRPRFLQDIGASDLMGAVAREVVEFYGDKIGEHPVGTGPFKLVKWRRASQIVLERNPDFREMLYDGEPAADDAAGQALLARFKGRRLPMVDRVEVSVIDENQPRWLAFLNGQIDGLVAISGQVPLDFANLAMPNNKIAPNLAKKGIQGRRNVNADSGLIIYNMEDPVLGGYTPDKIALRRALSLAYDTPREISGVRRGQAVIAHSPIVPHTTGYDTAFRSEMGEFSPPKAKALLDMFGYVDKDGDGWRDLPDGQPLVLRFATQPDQISRQLDEVIKRSYDAVAIKTRFLPAKWPENLKAARAGNYQIWSLGSSADRPDGASALQRLYGPASGGQNLTRFKYPPFDAIYDKLQRTPDGPEREALFLDAKKIANAYMPSKYQVNRLSTDLWHPWLIGFRRPLFWQEWWHRVDVDVELRDRMLR
ncbi:ABC transporter substrate-binding protein, partial [Ideonella sp. A 288]|uniref:ABC transporter substrate-binding protein n=1 Tax=Ideonella sp. A 288 TaxID=1962181 RepID=UPI001184C4C4